MLNILAQRAQARWWFYAVCLGAGLLSVADLATFDLATGEFAVKPFNLYDALERLAAIGAPLLALVANQRGWAVPPKPARKRGGAR
jgi:hypothetical protein